ncbi:LytTR family DNA-binding domain-containing protein [Emticicia sp. BO119]|uniref:LytR/AlgR family response regulator transcription factor n=1 Tax=Emticicia sp. BO119 TaxID=2757768 RepID=UPI0015F0CCFD|nr:response regulator [Emticicia sp. BO119]MBA4850625.1 DNA-binding response regulator [Emticicia sp. BO119]
MSVLKVLIIEDEVMTGIDIKETLEKAGHTITAIARNSDEAIGSLKKELPDIAIIDIMLRTSAHDGIQTATDLIKMHPMPIIYLTANSEMQTFQRAKDTSPAAYLLKPFRHNELALQVELAYHNYKANLPANTNPIVAEAIFLPFDKGLKKLIKQEVLYLKADGSYVKVYLKEEMNPYLFSMNLGHLAQYFSTPNFYRLSRSLLINLNCIERIERDHLYMKNQENPIQIPEGNKADLIKKLAVIRTP